MIAESDEANINSLFMSYEIYFPEVRRVDIRNIVNILQKNGLISFAGSHRYVATDKGIERASKELEIREKYEKVIEAHREMIERAEKF